MLCSRHVAASILQHTANGMMKCIRQVQEPLQHKLMLTKHTHQQLLTMAPQAEGMFVLSAGLR